MHEETLLRDLRRKLVELSQREGNVTIRRVRLWVGALAHTSPEALRHRWGDVVAGTLAQGATLELDVSDDSSDPAAQGIRLVDVVVEEGVGASPKWTNQTGA